MIEFAYDKYIVPYPHLDGADSAEVKRQQFLPDEIIDALASIRPQLDAFETAYQDRVAQGAPELSRTLPNVDGQLWRCRVYVPEPHMTRAETLTLVSDTLLELDPMMNTRLQDAVDNGWIDESQAHAPGFSRGRCGHKTWSGHDDGRIATMFMTWDGTINDPVYLAHESGHYCAYVARDSDTENYHFSSWTAPVVSEVQAFFFQHAFYDADLHSRRSDVMHIAIDLHRQGEMLNISARTNKALGTIEASKATALEDHAKGMDWYEALESNHSLHTDCHSPGNFIGAGLYERSKRMNSTERQNLLSVLYPTFDQFPDSDGKPTLKAILSSVGVETVRGLQELFADGVDSALRGPVPSQQLR